MWFILILKMEGHESMCQFLHNSEMFSRCLDISSRKQVVGLQLSSSVSLSMATTLCEG